MTVDTLKRTYLFLAFLMAQVLMLNRIQLFHCATPLLYVYFVLLLPRSYAKWAALLWCFALGLLIDIFSNTPGMASASLTLVGAIQPYLLELFIPYDADENMKVSSKNLSWGKFITYASIMVFTYSFVFFSLEAFNFFNWLYWLGRIVGSTIITLIFIVTLESVRE